MVDTQSEENPEITNMGGLLSQFKITLRYEENVVNTENSELEEERTDSISLPSADALFLFSLPLMALTISKRKRDQLFNPSKFRSLKDSRRGPNATIFGEPYSVTWIQWAQ